MDRIRNKYNPEASQYKAEKCLEGIQKSEYEGWVTHPCTKSLKLTLESALDSLVLNWVKGGYIAPTTDGTAIKQAEAAGMAAAIEEVMSYIEDMLENTQRENDPYEKAIYNP